MKTVVLGPPAAELETLITHRRAIGADRYDEIWEGEYHMAPAPHFGYGDLDQQVAELLGPRCRQRGLVMTGPCNIGRWPRTSTGRRSTTDQRRWFGAGPSIAGSSLLSAGEL